jgi:transcriptional regulator with XRE-family HTH domain
MATGTRIREARIAKGMSQEALANALNTKQSRVSKWERCVCKVDVDTLARVALALGVEVQELIEPADDVTPAGNEAGANAA